MMDRHATELLAQFCIAQRNAFDAHDWLRRIAAEGDAVALAAKYLSMTSWYGHEFELERIAAGSSVLGDSSAGLYRESQATDFDLPYFSAKVRLGIAQSQVRPAVRRERRHQRIVPGGEQADLFAAVRARAAAA